MAEPTISGNYTSLAPTTGGTETAPTTAGGASPAAERACPSEDVYRRRSTQDIFNALYPKPPETDAEGEARIKSPAGKKAIMDGLQQMQKCSLQETLRGQPK